MIALYPAILVHSQAEFLENLSAIQDTATHVHIDIADGRFVPNTTWADPDVIQRVLSISCELHLMVEHPLQEYRRWRTVASVRRVIAHVEANGLAPFLRAVRQDGKEASLAINAGTPLARAEHDLPSADGILFMGIEPGFQGKTFMPQVIEKINKFQRRRTTHFLEVDGGVNAETLPKIIKTGVDAVCVGSAIFHHGNPRENFLRLRQTPGLGTIPPLF